jgi:tetrahydromethanopterin S-methyltransferase subunit G
MREVIEMLDERDLQAIAQLLTQQLTQQKTEIMQEVQTVVQSTVQTEVARSEERIMQKVQAEFAQVEERLDEKISQAESRIMKSTAVMMDTEFKKQFRLLCEQQDHVLSDAANMDDICIIDGRLDDLEATVKRHAAEIARLKKAQ